MKRVFSFILTVLLVMSGCSAKKAAPGTSEDNPASAQATYRPKPKDYTEAIEQKLDDLDYEGAICVYYNGGEIYATGRGEADRDSGKANSPDLIYYAASLTKQFTAAGILLLCEEKKLSLDDRLGGFFPDCEYGDRVTVKQIMNMTSGIPSNTGGESMSPTFREDQLGYKVSADATDRENISAVLDWILSRKLSFNPGEKYEYSNSNYFLLARIIEAVSGEVYEDFITRRIIKPLRLNNTGFDYSRVNTKGYVHNSDDTQELVLRLQKTMWITYPGVSSGFANLCSSARDLAKWLSALNSGEVVSKDSLEIMFENNESGYGGGFAISEIDSVLFASHTGNFGTYMSEVVVHPYYDIEVVSLSNTLSNTNSDAAGEVMVKLLENRWDLGLG